MADSMSRADQVGLLREVARDGRTALADLLGVAHATSVCEHLIPVPDIATPLFVLGNALQIVEQIAAELADEDGEADEANGGEHG